MRVPILMLLAFTLAALPVARAADTSTPANPPASGVAVSADAQAETIDPAAEKTAEIYRSHRQEMIASLSRGASPHDWALSRLLAGEPQKPGSVDLLHQATAASPEDVLVQWIALLASGNAGREHDAALKALERLESDNAAVWLWSLQRVNGSKDQTALDGALAHMAASTRFNDHRADLLRALVDVHLRYPLPAQFYAFADPSVVAMKDLMPYVTAMAEVNALPSHGYQALINLCRVDPVSGKNTAHAEQCDAIGSMLARHGSTYLDTLMGFVVLRASRTYKDDDVRYARGQDWLFQQYINLQKEMYEGTDNAVTDQTLIAENVRAMRAYITDQIETGSEMEATRQALVRAHKSLSPPGDWVDTRSPFSPERLREEEERAAKERQRAIAASPATNRTAPPPAAH